MKWFGYDEKYDYWETLSLYSSNQCATLSNRNTLQDVTTPDIKPLAPLAIFGSQTPVPRGIFKHLNHDNLAKWFKVILCTVLRQCMVCN